MKKDHKTRSRILALILSLTLVITYMPASFFVYAANENEGSAQEAQIEDSANGVVDTGDDTTVNNDTTVTPDTSNNEPTDNSSNNEPTDNSSNNEQSDQTVWNDSDPAPVDGEADTGSESTEQSGKNASYTQADDLEAVVLEGKAAEEKSAAEEALQEETDLSNKDAKEIAKRMFAKSNLKSVPTSYPSELDGNKIQNITVKWVRENDPDNEDPELLVKPNADEKQIVRMEINYALGGEYNYGQEDIAIKIPDYIFKDRNGKDYGEMIIPYPQWPSTSDDYNWTHEDGYYILRNTRPLKSATKGFIQFDVTELVPHMLVDMEKTKDFNAYIEVTTHAGNTIALQSNDIWARVDTEATITQVTKKVYGKPEIVNSAFIPAGQRIEGEDRYLLITWYITVMPKANQVYTLDYKDYIPEEYRGFIIKATSADGRELTKDDAYEGYRTGKVLSYTVQTAYPLSEFEKETTYEFHNNIIFTCTEKDPDVVDENGNVIDPKKETTLTAHAKTTWNYADPQHLEPPGHYMIYKNGNDDTDKGNKTHKTIGGIYRTSSDLHMWSMDREGWFGNYSSALNEMQEEYAAHGEDGYIRLGYTINSIGYVMPWEFDEQSVFGEDGNQAAWNIANYTRRVKITSTDYGLTIGRKSSLLTPLKDYNYISVEFPESPWLYTGRPNKINPDGTWYAVTADDGTFLYTRDNDKSHWPDIKLQIQINGKWQDYAVASWNTGSFKIDFTDGGSQTDSVIEFPEDLRNSIQSIRTVVVMQNAATEGQTTQAAIDYDIRVVAAFRTTDSFMTRVGRAFQDSNAPSFYIYNRSNLYAEYADEVREGDQDPICTLGTPEYNNDMIHNKDGYNIISGYKTETMVVPHKESTYSEKEVDTATGMMTVHYKASVEERTFINSLTAYEDAIAEGRVQAQTKGVWRDLLPKGMIPDVELDPNALDSGNKYKIKLRSGDKITDIKVIPDYKGTGRYMLEVYCDLTPVPEQYNVSGSEIPYYRDVLKIEFDALIDLKTAQSFNYFDEGQAPHNVISFESANDHLGSIDHYKGEPDDPYSNNSAATAGAFKDKEERDAMKDADPDRDDPSFVYAGCYTELSFPGSGIAGLHKDVMTSNDGKWSSGVYYGDTSKARTAYVGGAYSYRLTYSPESHTDAKNIVLYDSLENFYAGAIPGESNDNIDVGAERWQGTFNGLDLKELRALGCEPRVYYSLIDNLALAKQTDDGSTPVNRSFDATIDGQPVWIEESVFLRSHNLSEVKAVAVDASRKTDGSEFVLKSGEIMQVYINMIAPSGDKAIDALNRGGKWGESAQAYNNCYETCTMIDEKTGATTDNFPIFSDYTKVGLKPFEIDVYKIWDDDDDRDGLRKNSIDVKLFADGEYTGKTVTLSDENEWYAKFTDINYSNPDGSKIEYTLEEDPSEIEGYEMTIVPGNITGTTQVAINKHLPEKIDINGSKSWRGDEAETRPAYIYVMLYENGKYLTEKKVQPDANGDWSYAFTNLYKYENGQEIEYTVKERREGSIPAATYSYEDVVNGVDITNKYHPYGDLEVEKITENVTDASKDKEFTFHFFFWRTEENEEGEKEDVPVLNSYEYEVKEGDTVVSTGRITDDTSGGGTISIKGGQTIHVKEIDEYVNYEVTEDDVPGFTLRSHNGSEGVIKPNDVQHATFVNRYRTKGSIKLEGWKGLVNKEVKKNDFTFNIYKVDKDGNRAENPFRSGYTMDPDRVDTDENGSVRVSIAPIMFADISYTGADDGETYTYYVCERIPDGAVNDDGVSYADATEEQKKAGGFKLYGYTYDSTGYTVVVKVSDNGDGTMTCDKKYYDQDGNEFEVLEEGYPGLLFLNTFETKGKLPFKAWKTIPQVSELEEGAFEFELFGEFIVDENGNTISRLDNEQLPKRAVNASNGVVQFGELEYDQTDIGMTYYYIVSEVIPMDAVNADGVRYADATPAQRLSGGFMSGDYIYDSSLYGYKVTVGVNTRGELTFSQTNAIPTPILNNDGQDIGLTWEDKTQGSTTFVNRKRPGRLEVSKLIQNADEEDPNTQFHFFVQLIGDIPDGDLEFELHGYRDYYPFTPPTPPIYMPRPSAQNDEGEKVESEEAEKKAEEAVIEESTSEEEKPTLREKVSSFIEDTLFTRAYGATGGTFEGVDWLITDEGELVLGNQGETQRFNYAQAYDEEDYYRSWPWRRYSNQITSVTVDGVVECNGDMSGMFAGLSKATEFNLANLDTSDATGMHEMFYNCTSVETLDLSGFNTAKCQFFFWMFKNCTALKTLDISSFNMGKSYGTTSYEMFNNVTELNKIKLFPGFSLGNFRYYFQTDSAVRNSNGVIFKLPADEEWVNESGTRKISSLEYANGERGWWTRQEKPDSYTVNFTTDSTWDLISGSMPSIEGKPGEDLELPANAYSWMYHNFIHWQDANNPNVTYEDKAVIPAGTYHRGDEITLVAVLEETENKVTVKDGLFDFWLTGGTVAVFDNLPADTQYVVWEETPEGWVQVDWSGTSGYIHPDQASKAQITNSYQPDHAYAQLHGIKMLDNRGADGYTYEFELLDEKGRVIQTVPNLDGGFIQFEPIEYLPKDAGTYTYKIREVVKDEDDTILYDSHEETVKVIVSENSGKMTATVKYDEDGVLFKNKTKPGELNIHKKGGPITDQNKNDKFKYKVTFYNEYGMPIEDSINWYAVDTETGKPRTFVEKIRQKLGLSHKSIKLDKTDKASKTDNTSTTNLKTAEEDSKNIVQESSGSANSAASASVNLKANNRSGEEEILYSGTHTYDGNSVDWRITKDGELILGKEGETQYAQTEDSWNGFPGKPEWSDYGDQIKSVRFEGPVIGVKCVDCFFMYLSNDVDYDFTYFDTSQVTSVKKMFMHCGGVSADWSKLNTDSVKSAEDMFGNSTATSLDLSGLKLANCSSAHGMFANSKTLEELNISTLGNPTSGIYAMYIFSRTPKLKKITLGENFNFSGGEYLPTPSPVGAGKPYTGKWVRENDVDGQAYTPAQFSTAYNNNHAGMAGVWIWQRNPNLGIIHFDPMGGTANWKWRYPATQYSADPAVAEYSANGGAEDFYCQVAKPYTGNISDVTPQFLWLPDSDVITKGNMILVGWSTNPDGSGSVYEPGNPGGFYGKTPTYGIVDGNHKEVTLYAKWIDQRRVTVNHYTQKADMSGYELKDTEVLLADPSSQFTPPVKNYAGFLSPQPQTVTVQDNHNTVVNYYYDRYSYKIIFDGNGATSGEMAPLAMVEGIAKDLPQNEFYKDKAFFKEWNTEADGSGTSYANTQSVVDISSNGKDVTLYAQWFDLEPGEPTNGSIIVECKAGETIIIPDLPAGTTYTIEELDGPDYMPQGWTHTDTVGDEGMIVPNEINNATFSNVYHAEGEAEIFANKHLTGADLENGQFEFELYHYVEGSGGKLREEIIETAVNTESEGSDGKVHFTPIHYTEADLAEDGSPATYTYFIREVKPENAEPGMTYDSRTIEVEVTVADAGHGLLETTVTYDPEDNTFVNTPGKGNLTITKKVTEDSPNDRKFRFKIELFNEDGSTHLGRYYGRTVTIFPGIKDGAKGKGKIDDTVKPTDPGWPAQKPNVYSGCIVTIAAGDIYQVSDLPPGVTYKITELDETGWSLVSSENAEGVIVSNETAKAVFTNRYDSNGSVTLEGQKKLVGKELEEGEFTFEVRDENGAVVSTGTNDASGHIEFTPITFTFEDLKDYEKYSHVFNFTVYEVQPSDADSSINYDKTIYKVNVDAEDDGTGQIKTKVSGDWDHLKFINTKPNPAEAEIQATKVINEWNTGDRFTFRLKPRMFAPMPLDSEGNELTKAEGVATEDAKTVNFGKIPYSKVGTYVYEITEVIPDNAVNANGTTYANATADEKAAGGFVFEDVTYDSTIHTATVTVSDPHNDGNFVTTVKYDVSSEDTDEASGKDELIITNSREDRLRIRKVLDGYVENGAKSNITIAFKIIGKDADGTEIYSNYGGLSFAKGDDLSKDLIIDGLPACDTIIVKEVYSAGYKPSSAELRAVYNDKSGYWEVEFNNKHNGYGPKSGVVNKYKDGNITSREGLTGSGGEPAAGNEGN